MMREHGQAKKYYHDIEGYNGRLDALQAGILSVKLRHLAEWNRKRQAAARRYDELLSSVEGVMAPDQPEVVALGLSLVRGTRAGSRGSAEAFGRSEH